MFLGDFGLMVCCCSFVSTEYSLLDLKVVTNNFSSYFIVFESGEKASNVVYKGSASESDLGG